MNHHRVTTLLSKTVQKIRESGKKRGIRFSPQDLERFVEEWLPRQATSLLEYGRQFFHPLVANLGLQTLHLSHSQIEVLLPFDTHNSGEFGNMHEGAIVAATIEANLIFWRKHWPLGEVQIEVSEIQFSQMQAIRSNCHIKAELSDAQIEDILGELRIRNSARFVNSFYLYDDRDQRQGEVQLTLKLSYLPAIQTRAQG